MTDYNDGKWHGWNGGECPVHPETEVAIVTSPSSGGDNGGAAKEFVWDKPDYLGNPIVAFRVVKEHREPRQFWIEPTTYHVIEIIQAPEGHVIAGYIRVREVLE